MSTNTTVTNGIQAGNLFEAFLPFLLAAIFLFAVLFLVYWLLKNGKGIKAKGGFFTLLASQAIDQFSNIHLIKYSNHFYVIITSQGAIKVLEKIEDENEIEELNLKYASSRHSAFNKILNRKIFEDQLNRLDQYDG
ncbi:MAG TPA: flagellar biosynthetic protein FliO [Thermotogota bacterium]|nr:flagellar biosynthetic protein FliO [Thermotogota bacterium]